MAMGPRTRRVVRFALDAYPYYKKGRDIYNNLKLIKDTMAPISRSRSRGRSSVRRSRKRKRAPSLSSGYKRHKSASSFTPAMPSYKGSRSLSVRRTSGAYADKKILVSGDGGTTHSHSQLKYKRMDGLTTAKRLNPTDIIRDQAHSGVTTPTYGVYGLTMGMKVLDKNDMYNLYLRGIQTNTTSVTNNTPSVNDQSRQVWLESFRANWIFTNQGAGTTDLQIYDLIAKEDMPDSESPVLAWQRGLTAIAGTAITEETNFYFGSKPTDSKDFRKRFKVIKHTKVELMSGRHHKHQFVFDYQGKINMEKAFKGATSVSPNLPGDFVKGVTCVTMLVINGMPVDDVDSGNVGNVSLDGAKLIYVRSQVFRSVISTLKGKHLEYVASTLPPTMTKAYGQNPNSRGGYESVANVLIDKAYT